MSNFELPALRKHGKHARHAADGRKRPRLLVPLITAAAVTAAAVSVPLLTAGGPASTAAPSSAAAVIAVSGTGRPAEALRTVLDRVQRTGNGQYVLAPAGLGSRARATDRAFVAHLNTVVRQAGTLDLAAGTGPVIDLSSTRSAASRATTVITILPGVTLTISSTTVELDISAQDISIIEAVAALGAGIAGFVGSILAITGVPGGAAISSIVASSITLGSDAIRLCSALDGGNLILSISAPPGKLPTASACGVTI